MGSDLPSDALAMADAAQTEELPSCFSPLPSPPLEKNFDYTKPLAEILGTKMPTKNTDTKPLSDHPNTKRHADNSDTDRTVEQDALTADNPMAEEERIPLTLLDLPVDILAEVINELSDTNDLVSLALVHSALHCLVIPQIYSRFDIVWPDPHRHHRTRPAVDALTHGLATLVMASNAFGKEREIGCQHDQAAQTSTSSKSIPRRGNNYATFTKHFSIGNGPADLVQEYVMTKESGWMLGTLAALALARMHNLESFVWDMPSGIIASIWNSLSSLGDKDTCRLERVWTRWHKSPNTSLYSSAPSGAPWVFMPSQPSGGVGANLTGFLSSIGALAKRGSIVQPTYSILPPIKSLNVLDIDELAYIEEMATCVEKSWWTLRELRVGIAEHAQPYEWNRSHASDDYLRTDVSPLAMHKRKGGVLGSLLGRRKWADERNLVWPATRLRLEVLELERVYLSPVTLLAGLDWAHLTELTLLDCPMTEVFWEATCCKMFNAKLADLETARLKVSMKKPLFPCVMLRLKKLFTNTVTKPLMHFLRFALTSNTLEVLILQASSNPAQFTDVRLQEIFNGPVKSHHASLKKLSIDSSWRGSDKEAGTFASQMKTRYRRWMLHKTQLHYLTSGALSQLREVCIVVRYGDWHAFLQRLPNVPTLRSLYLPLIAGLLQADTKWRFRSREAALQIIDIITLRPEMELCYIGIGDRCFEIVPDGRVPAMMDWVEDYDEDGFHAHEDMSDEELHAQITGQLLAPFQPHPDSVSADLHFGLDLATAGNTEGGQEPQAGPSNTDDGQAAHAPQAGPAGGNPPVLGAHGLMNHLHHDFGDEESDEEHEYSEDSDVSSADSDGIESVASRSTVPFGIRDIMWFDERVEIFKARHGRIRA